MNALVRQVLLEAEAAKFGEEAFSFFEAVADEIEYGGYENVVDFSGAYPATIEAYLAGREYGKGLVQEGKVRINTDYYSVEFYG